MVVRASDSRRNLVDVIRGQGKQTDEVVRRQGRGTGALRNAQGQAYTLDPSSGLPLLVPYTDGSPVGSALKYTPSGVEARSADDSEGRDFTVRNLRVTGNVMVDGMVAAAGTVRSEGLVQAGLRLEVDNSYRIGTIATSGKPFIYGPSDNVGIVASAGNLYVRNNGDTAAGAIYDSKQPAPSERALKDHHGDLVDALAVVEAWRPGRGSWRAGTAYDDGGREHAWTYVDEIAATAPEAVAGTDSDGNRIPDERAQIAYLVAAVQTLAEQNRGLRSALDRLQARSPRAG